MTLTGDVGNVILWEGYEVVGQLSASTPLPSFKAQLGHLIPLSAHVRPNGTLMQACWDTLRVHGQGEERVSAPD